MTGAPGFTVEVDQNPYLPDGASQVDAIVLVATSGPAAPTGTAYGLEMIIIDCSTSMSGAKMRAARRATAAAIAELRDGVSFTVVAGTHRAEQIYPQGGGTATAGPDTRAEAAAMVGRLMADGGTAIGTWLTLARRTADQHPGALKHAVLLTDGQNGEKPDMLATALETCLGRFTCDCRGVGTNWKVDELRTISSALLARVSKDLVARSWFLLV